MYKLMIIIFLSWLSLGWAANHYVDKNATGNNNGTSWVNAWESFDAIQWSTVNPGDILYISGGTDSTIYSETLNLERNLQGTADAYITIRNSWDVGHNGRVIIDGGNNTRYCVKFSGGSSTLTAYIIIYGLELRDGSSGLHIGEDANNITLDSLLITNWSLSGLRFIGNNYGIHDIIIQNSDIIGAVGSGADCYEGRFNQDITFRNNFIHQRNDDDFINLHADCILTIQSKGYRIYNNIMVADSNVQGQTYILRAWADNANPEDDSVIVYNNYFYQGGIWFSETFPTTTNLMFRWQGGGSQVRPPTYAAHNTIVTWGPTVQVVKFETAAMFHNNIVAQMGSNSKHTMIAWDVWDVDSMKNNIIYRETRSIVLDNFWHGNGISIARPNFTQWTNDLGGTGKWQEDPLFVQKIASTSLGGTNQGDNQQYLNGELQAGSPAINAGFDLQNEIIRMGLPWVYCGKRIPGTLGVPNGATRPTSSTPTVGAFDNINGGIDIIQPEVIDN